MPQIDDRTAYPLDGNLARELRELWQGAPNQQTGTTYTIQASDFGRRISFNNVSAITVTIPSGLPTDFYCYIRQTGAGQVTVAAGSGVTLNSYSSQFKLLGQYATAYIDANGTNSYIMDGALTA